MRSWCWVFHENHSSFSSLPGLLITESQKQPRPHPGLFSSLFPSAECLRLCALCACEGRRRNRNPRLFSVNSVDCAQLGVSTAVRCSEH